jgi:hypothetical protein
MVAKDFTDSCHPAKVRAVVVVSSRDDIADHDEIGTMWIKNGLR